MKAQLTYNVCLFEEPYFFIDVVILVYKLNHYLSIYTYTDKIYSYVFRIFGNSIKTECNSL